MQKSIWIFFIFLMGHLLYGQKVEKPDLPDLSVHLEIISSNRGIVIPPVYLTDKTDQVSNEKDSINSSLVYNTNENDVLTPGYLYWNKGSWHQLFQEPTSYDYLFLWDVDNVELTYLDDSGDIRVIGINGIENARFIDLKSDSKTLKYENEVGSHILVDLGQIVGEGKTVKTLVYRRDNTLLFINKEEKAVQVDLTKGPQEVSNTVRELEDKVVSKVITTDSLTELETDIVEDSLVADVDLPSETDEGLEVEDEPLVSEGEIVSEKEEEVEKHEKNEPFLEEKEQEVVRLGREIKSINDNEDGTFTIVYAGGSKFTSRDLNHPQGGLKEEDRELVDVVNNGDGSFTAEFSDGTSLLSSEIDDFQNFGGSAEEGYPGVELVIDNGDGTYNIILTDGTELSSVDLAALSNPEEKEAEEDDKGVLSIVSNEDETYTVTFTDGTEMNSKDLSEINMPVEEQVDLEEDEKIEEIEAGQDVLDDIEIEGVATEEMYGVLAGEVGTEVVDTSNNEVEKDKINSGKVESDAAEEDIENSHSAEEQAQKYTPLSRGVKSIEEKTDGTHVIALTDGTVFVTPNFYSEDENRSQARNIKSIIDNDDGTFTVVLTGGIELSSIDIPNLPEPLDQEEQESLGDVGVPDVPENTDKAEEEGQGEIEMSGAELELPANNDEPDELLNLEETTKSEGLEPEEIYEEKESQQEATEESIEDQTELEPELDYQGEVELDTVESGTENTDLIISHDEIIKLQKQEIEALKSKEKEKEEELQEMNKRLKRLELLFDGESEE